jgi:hypothetical protein
MLKQEYYRGTRDKLKEQMAIDILSQSIERLNGPFPRPARIDVRSITSMILLTRSKHPTEDGNQWGRGKPVKRLPPTTFEFKVDGEELTGIATSSQGQDPFTEGEISGDEISFSMEAGGAKVSFKGTVTGNEIKMTRQRKGREARTFTLKPEIKYPYVQKTCSSGLVLGIAGGS